jgi:hypothetical protein
MIQTKNLISELKDVPRAWVFEYYLNLKEKLTGQDVKIKSPLHAEDWVPSFCVYFSKTVNNYMFKDFSTGKGGDGVTLVQLLLNLSTRGESAHKVLSDYNQFILNSKEDYSLREFKLQSKYKVVDFKKRGWTNLDSKFWLSFHIGSKLLEFYNVWPLESYKMEREIDDHVQNLVIQGSNYIYGYFRQDGSLYKIYQPYVRDNKFIKVRDYIQGTDQLTYQTKFLVINSSLKDIASFMSLKYPDVESVAPDSENTLISEHVITSYKLKYKAITVCFDIDLPGQEAALKYNTKYNIPITLLPMSKDLSDSVRDAGPRQVKEVLTPLLKQALCSKLELIS